MVTIKLMVKLVLTIFAFWIIGLGIASAAPNVQRYIDNKNGTISTLTDVINADLLAEVCISPKF